MTFSKLLSSVLILSSAMSFMACTRKSPLQGSGSATFVAMPLTASNYQVASVDAGTGLAEKLSFDVKVCLQDIARLQPVVAQNFTITGGKTEQSVRTDSAGCIYWPETVEFDYLQPEVMMQLDRSIKGAESHKGEVAISLALNPWLGVSATVVDLKNGSVPPSQLQSEKSADLASEGQILIPDIAMQTFNPVSENGKTTIDALIKMTTQVYRKKLDSSQTTESLQKGKFHVELYLMEVIRVQSSDQNKELAKQVLEVDGDNGLLKMKTNFKLNTSPRADSNFELLFKVHPSSGRFVKSGQEGKIRFTNLIGETSSATAPLPGTLEHVVGPLEAQGIKMSPALSQALVEASPQFGFNIDNILIDKGAVTAVNSNGTPQTLQIRVGACVKDAFQVKPIALQDFLVAIVKDAKEVPKFTNVVSDSSGCLRWQTSESFNYNATSHWSSRFMVIKSEHPPYQDVEKRLEIYVNPWESGTLMGWDSRYGQPPQTSSDNSDLNAVGTSGPNAVGVGTDGASSSHSGANRIKISALSYAYMGREFSVDQLLNLTVKRKYQLRFTPLISRGLSYESGSGLEILKAGHLKIKTLLLSKIPNAREGKPVVEPLTFFDAEAEVVAGAVNFVLTLPVDFRELPLLGYRNQLMIEITDASDRHLTSGTVAFPFIALEGTGTVGAANASSMMTLDATQIVPESATIEEWKSKGHSAIFQHPDSVTGKDVFESITKFRDPLKLRHDELNLTFQQLQKIAEDQNLSIVPLEKFCGFLNKSVGFIRRHECQISPERVLKVVPMIQVAKIIGAPEELHGDTFTFSVAASFGESYTKSHSKTGTASTNVQYNIGAEWETPLKGIVGVGAGVGAGFSQGYTWSTSDSKTSSKSATVVVSEVKNLAVEKVKLGFQAVVNECFVITAVDPADLKTAPFWGYHLCRSGSVTKSLNESWFYINEQGILGSTALRDLANPTDAGWIKVVRGETAFDRVRMLLQDSTQTIETNHTNMDILSDGMLGNVLKNYSRIVPAFSDNNVPGTLDMN